MPNSNFRSPGVYIEEIAGLPPSVAQVETAIPAFIGYTPRADFRGSSRYGQAMRIASWMEFVEIYGPAEPGDFKEPEYYLLPQRTRPERGEWIQTGGLYYAIVADPSTVYYLCKSVRHFFDCGGQELFVVSVGGYGKPLQSPGVAELPPRNPNVALKDLQKGLATLKAHAEITLYVCPDAALLDPVEHGRFSASMLEQSETMGSSMSLLDLPGGDMPHPLRFGEDVLGFRDKLGGQNLRSGAAYYPFVVTGLRLGEGLTFANLFGGDWKRLADILDTRMQPNVGARKLLSRLRGEKVEPVQARRLDGALRRTSKTYCEIMEGVARAAATLPASGGVAGVFARVDAERGVWKAPANVALASVVDLPIHLTSAQQAGLNVDPVGGKSINALRSFSGRGIRIWGARTLAGNNVEWRYIPSRRMAIMVSQSVEGALRQFVFEPNDANTWVRARGMVENFLSNLWRSGGLSGAKAEHAFFVRVGLGQTMTAADVLAGVMRVELGLALVRPAEFVVLRFEQKMGES